MKDFLLVIKFEWKTERAKTIEIKMNCITEENYKKELFYLFD